ncbi:hypothetical protein [Kitasatospora sp. NPDC085464]|uniref:hypothetical protein n=1 Tax=Kitasatospora sp. NPDC085464 TaxID=3364063 RepID=UPI0037CA9494
MGGAPTANLLWVTLPAFHVGHHVDPSVNLGFYTTVWDRLFGTVDPAYDRTRTGTATPTNRPC